MAVTIDTGSVASHERLEYWADTQSRLFFPLDVRAPASRPFAGRAHSHELGPVLVRRVAADGHGVRRTRRAIAASDPEQFELSLMLFGTQRLSQRGRSALLGPGDLVCMDSSRPYVVTSPGRFEMLVFAVPMGLLRPHVDLVRGRTATAVRPLAGLPAVASAAAHFISTRYLHRLFEREGVTVSEWIRARRLECCRRDLEDPALAAETVLEIASRWGLRNPGHFSRIFRAAYGCSPSSVRTRASARR